MKLSTGERIQATIVLLGIVYVVVVAFLLTRHHHVGKIGTGIYIEAK